MKIEVHKDEISYIRTIPFEITIDEKTYKGVLSEFETNTGGMPDFSYEIDWEDDIPEVNEDEIKKAVIDALRKD
jgi:effector-binding domain-containing protein